MPSGKGIIVSAKNLTSPSEKGSWSRSVRERLRDVDISHPLQESALRDWKHLIHRMPDCWEMQIMVKQYRQTHIISKWSAGK